jgi:membrane fusion protein, multidrug efflux system
MKKLINITLTLAVAVIVASCSSASKDKQTQLEELKKQQKEIADKIKKLEAEVQPANAVVAVKSKEVGVKELKPDVFNYVLQTQGGVEAEENIMVSAKTPGIVTGVYVKEGQSVSQGQVLAQVDNSLILKGIEELKSGLEMANIVYERQKSLWDQKIGTEIQYLTEKNKKESLEKKLATMNEQNEMSRIKSPINGSIEEVVAKVGENTAPGMPAFRVIGTRNLKVVANISEAYISQIKLGNTAQVEFMDQGKGFNGRVSFVGKNIDPLSRTFSVEVPIPAGSVARPNMSSTVNIIFNTLPSALAVPVNVVQTINNQKVVYVAEDNKGQLIARKRVVEVGGIYNNMAEIKSGLKTGDKIITFGYQGLNDGELVKI